jgi:hypothetical protein
MIMQLKKLRRKGLRWRGGHGDTDSVSCDLTMHDAETGEKLLGEAVAKCIELGEEM